MHGQRKRDVKVLTEEERVKKEAQGEKVIAMITELLNIRSGEVSVPNPNEFCDLLANMCPDLPTIYNYKRELLLSKLASTQSKQDQYKMLSKELMLVTMLLKMSPKSYSLWSYRQWLVLECKSLERLFAVAAAAAAAALAATQSADATTTTSNTSEPIPSVVEMEMKLCNKMLEYDERNFHCWNYRNWLIADVEKDSAVYVAREIAYTQAKYEKNFSNFSALHFRAKNLVKQHEASLSTTTLSQEQVSEIVNFKLPLSTITEELEMIKNAIFIQPNEQGVWLYHKWIMTLLVPFRIIAAASLDSNGIRLTCSVKIQAENVKKAVTLFDVSGAKIDAFSLEPVRLSGGVAQEFQLCVEDKEKSVHRIVVEQPAELEAQVVEYSIKKRSLLRSVFERTTENGGSFVLLTDEKDTSSDARIAAVKKVIEDEVEFVNGVIECEAECKFAQFHFLLLVQMQQSLDLVLDPLNQIAALESTKKILSTIDQLEALAKRQTNYIKNLRSQYETLASLQNILVEQKNKSSDAVESFEMPSNPTYEVDLFIAYSSLLKQGKQQAEK